VSNESNRADVALTSSEQELRLLVDTIPTLVWTAGPEGDIEYVNKRVLEYFGAPLGEIVGWGWAERVHPDDVAFKTRTWLANLESGTAHDAVCRFRGADGQYRWFAVSGAPLKAGDGRVICWYGVLIDIDDRRKAEEALRESEYKLRQIFETVPSPLWSAHPAGEPTQLNQRMLGFAAQLQAILNVLPAYTWYSAPSGGLTFVNKRTAEYLGVPKDHPLRFGIDIGAQWDDWVPLLHPDDQEESRKYWSNLLRTGEGGEHSYRVRSAQGDYRWFLTRIEPLRGSDGTLLLWLGATLDIEELKCAEQALRESEYKLRQIIDTVPSLLWSAGPDGEPTHVSQRMLDYSGMRFEDFKHRGWEAFVHPADFPETAKAFYHAIQTGTSYEGVMRLRRADGEFRWHHARCEPLRDRPGRIIQWYGLSVDIDERKRAEDLLRRSEAHLAEAQRLSNTGSAVYNDTTILYWSDETYRIMGFDPRKGLPAREASHQRIHPDDRERARKEARRADQHKKDYTLEYRIVLPSGTIKHIELSAHHKFSTSGELVEVISTLVDVTERKRAEQALRESEGKFRDYAETASDWFWEIGPDYKFTLLTENAFGSHAADRIGTACWEHALDFETEPEKWRLIQATLDSRKPFRDFIYCSARRNGSPMYVKASGKPVFDANGEFRGYRGTGTDVTAIIRAQEALRESERSSRSAIDGIAGLVAVMAPNGEVETVNRQCLEYFGRSLEELKSWGTNDAVHPEDLPRVLELFKRGMASGIPFNFELRLRRFDGEYRWFDSRGVPIRDDSGRIARWYVLLTDIEDRTRALARLDQMQSDFAHMNRVSMMGELAASLSHEITQPIAAARNYARAALNFLDQQPPDLGEVKKQLGRVVGAADRSGEIIERIRDHIKKAPPRKTRFDLNHAIDEVIVLARSAITRNGVSVQTLLAEGLAAVQGDRVQLQQVVLNLVLNAVEAMGSVEARTRELLISTEQAKGVLVAVRDSGPGIDPENLERVFEAFYTTKTSGMGMGLSICRSIIDAHGGRLWAGVNRPRGAVFQFTLPDAEKEIMDPRPAALHTRERYEDSASDDHHPLAYEDNKRPHRSGREPDQRRWGGQ
jgi:PAS domain S-box-containing protein